MDVLGAHLDEVGTRTGAWLFFVGEGSKRDKGSITTSSEPSEWETTAYSDKLLPRGR